MKDIIRTVALLAFGWFLADLMTPGWYMHAAIFFVCMGVVIFTGGRNER